MTLKEQLKMKTVPASAATTSAVAAVAAVAADSVSNKTKNQVFRSSVWGHTCDGIDCIVEQSTELPLLELGQWLYFKNMGAYTTSAGSNFNGFSLPNKVYLEQ